MAAGKLDLYIEQGANFYKLLTLQDATGAAIDLTGYTFAGQIRRKADSGAVLLAFTFTILNQTTNRGQLELTLTALQTATLPDQPQPTADRIASTFAYDIEMTRTSDGFVARLLEGKVTLSPEVTQ